MEYTDEYIVKKENLIDIADKMREKLNENENNKITIDKMPEKINEVYHKGMETIFEIWGKSAKLGAGIFDDVFSNSSLNNNTMTAIMDCWDENVKIKRANRMFQYATNISDALYTNKLDFSQSSSLHTAFFGSTVTKLMKIDARSAVSGWNGMANIFYNCPFLESIDEFYPSTQAIFNGTFGGKTNLTKVIFMSEIKQNNLHLGSSTNLNKASIESILKCLSDDTNGLAVTLSIKAVKKAFEDGPGKNNGIVETEENGTIKLTGPFIDFWKPTEIQDYQTSIPYGQEDGIEGVDYYIVNEQKFVLLKNWGGKTNWVISLV